MTLRRLLKRVIGVTSKVPVLGSIVIGSYQARLPKTGWNRQHPFDLLHGVDTSGSLPDYMLAPGATAYGAAQPSIIRRALAAIPAPQTCHFLDLGCGKGRPLLIATEFGFSAVTGVEFSAPLSRVAQSNAATYGKAHPERTRVEIVTGDALAYRLPESPLVIFLYNPFRQPLMEKLLANIEATLRQAPRDLYVVYYNPVCADLLDASSALERRYAAQLSYDPGEVGYGPDTSDALVIWQNRGNAHPRPDGIPDARVIVISPHSRVEVEASG